MSSEIVVLISLVYLGVVFVAAQFFKNNKILTNNRITYALSLCVYCTAWTFYGSVGRAADSGLDFLGVYLGPTLVAPFWIIVLRKILKISKYLRITSIADFISSRYGKNTFIGFLVSVLCLSIVVPYISIQLKAFEFSFFLLSEGIGDWNFNYQEQHFYKNPALFFGLTCAIFAIFFGTVKVDPSEKHPGIVSVIAIESIIKLLAFLFGSIVIVFVVFQGNDNLLSDVNYSNLNEYFDLSKQNTSGNSWFWIMTISAFAFILLPRQFHMAVVENTDPDHVKTASWLTPLYLLLISAMVIPVAIVGKIIFKNSIESDTFLLSIPIQSDLMVTASIVFVGGLAASSGMIISSLISMSIMLSNNIFLPLIIRLKKENLLDIEKQLLPLRRILIFSILVLSFLFLKTYSSNYSLVSVGLISFAGIAQLIPVLFLGMYWKYANIKGAIAGLSIGIIIWAYTLPFANLAQLGIVNEDILTSGLFGIDMLRPTALFGLENWNPISHSCVWSLFLNAITTVVVSLYTSRSALEIAQSDIFLNPDKYLAANAMGKPVIKREANFEELKTVLSTILGRKKIDKVISQYAKSNNISTFQEYADSSLIQYLENYLSGSIGSASSRVILENIIKNEPVQANQLFEVLDKTHQLYEYAIELESKSEELEIKSNLLEEANKKLQELDQLKNEFISNVTHELRTPLTSIRSLSSTLKTYELADTEKVQIIEIINSESQRISNLVNQVLDIRKLEVHQELEIENFNLREMVDTIVKGFDILKEDRTINVNGGHDEICTDKRKLKQIIINLLNNAVKFTSLDGEISINLSNNENQILIEVIDTGIGIDEPNIDIIFERFYQGKTTSETKNIGSGLGLAICKTLVELLDGNIKVQSLVGVGTKFKLILKNFSSADEE